MKLVIAEKPKMARALRDGLNEIFVSKISDNGLTGYYEGNDTIITFARGHLLKMYDIDDYFGEKTTWKMDVLPYIPEKFKYKPTDDPLIKKQLNVIKTLMHRADVTEIIHLGDPDREGELLVRLILAYNKNDKPVKRMWCLAILPDAAAEAYKNLRKIEDTDSWFQEGLARQRLDWMWGLNLTRFLSLKSGFTMPVGRVLVPIVKYIYDRDMKIKNFVIEYSWGVEGVLKKGGFSATLRNKDLVFNPDDKMTAENIAGELAKLPVVVTNVTKKNTTKYPNKLFSLLKLQGWVNKKYKISMDDSMKAIQELYLDGFLTYPRTPTEYVSSDEKQNVQKIVNMLISKGYLLKFHTDKTVFDDSKCQGHTALTITSKLPSESEKNSWDRNKQLVYDAVFNRFVSNFAAEKPIIEETTVSFKCGKYDFKITGENVVKDGFLKYEPTVIRSKLPDFTLGESFFVPFTVVQKESSPPNKVTVTELGEYLKNPYKDKIKNMDSDDELYELLAKGCTIGTEATTTKIISNAIKYGYISQGKTSYSIEEKGVFLIELLDKLNINLYREKNIEFNMELKEIYNLKKTVPDAVASNKAALKKIINDAKDITVQGNKEVSVGSMKVVGKCPRCGKDVIENSKAFSCIGWKDEPKCSFVIWKSNKLLESQHKKVTATMVKSLLSKGRVSVKGLVSPKTGKKYDADIVLSDEGKYVNLNLDFAGKKPKK